MSTNRKLTEAEAIDIAIEYLKTYGETLEKNKSARLETTRHTAEEKSEKYITIMADLATYKNRTTKDKTFFLMGISKAARNQQELQDEKGWTLTSDFSQALFAVRSLLLEQLKYGATNKEFLAITAEEFGKDSKQYEVEKNKLRYQKEVLHRTPIASDALKNMLLTRADLGDEEAIHMATDLRHKGTKLNLFYSPKTSKMATMGTTVFERIPQEEILKANPELKGSLEFDSQDEREIPVEPDQFSPWPFQRKFYLRHYQNVLAYHPISKSLNETTFDQFVANLTVKEGEQTNRREAARMKLKGSIPIKAAQAQEPTLPTAPAVGSTAAAPAASSVSPSIWQRWTGRGKSAVSISDPAAAVVAVSTSTATSALASVASIPASVGSLSSTAGLLASSPAASVSSRQTSAADLSSSISTGISEPMSPRPASTSASPPRLSAAAFTARFPATVAVIGDLEDKDLENLPAPARKKS